MSDGKRPIRVLIADDRVITRLGTAALLGTQPDISVVGQAADGVQAINLFRETRPDVLVLDMRMPALDGAAVTATLCKEDAKARILILSHYDSQTDVSAALQAGARGYLSKDTQGDELVTAIRAVAQGRRYLPGDIAARLADRLTSEPLSRREQQVLERVFDGLTNRQIGQELGISPWTAALHVKNVMGKLGAKTRTEAVAIAVEKGLLGRR